MKAADLNAIEVERVSCNTTQELRSGIRSGHYGYYVEKGALRILSQKGNQIQSSGSLIWIGAGARTVLQVHENATWLVLRVRNRSFSSGSAADQFARETLFQISRLSMVQPALPLTAQTRKQLYSLMRKMKTAAYQKTATSLVRLKGDLLMFLMDIQDDRDFARCAQTLLRKPGLAEQVHRVLSLIEEHGTTISDVSDLASKSGLSRSSLYRLFDDASMSSPASVIEEVRLDAAITALEGTNKTVLTIAMETGFGSLSTFYRSFKNRFGCAPADWRRRIKTG